MRKEPLKWCGFCRLTPRVGLSSWHNTPHRSILSQRRRTAPPSTDYVREATASCTDKDTHDPASRLHSIARSLLATSPRKGRTAFRVAVCWYPGTDAGIDDIDITLVKGGFTVVTGRIGAGKTTLLRALLGLVAIDSGEVRWNGEKVEDPASFFVPPQSAYTPQVPKLFSLTLRDNLLLGLEESDETILAAVRSAALDRDVLGMPDGLDTMVGPRGMRLSGGQIQRAAAARMIVRRPELLVFDDLSSALDVDTERTLWRRLSTEHAHATALVVSHRRPALQRAGQIIVMRDGSIEAVGDLEGLLKTSAEFRRLWTTDVTTPRGHAEQ